MWVVSCILSILYLRYLGDMHKRQLGRSIWCSEEGCEFLIWDSPSQCVCVPSTFIALPKEMGEVT